MSYFFVKQLPTKTKLNPSMPPTAEKMTFPGAQAAYVSLQSSSNPSTGVYICIRTWLSSYQMVAEKKLNACPGLSELEPPAVFAVFAKKSTLNLGGRYGKAGY